MDEVTILKRRTRVQKLTIPTLPIEIKCERYENRICLVGQCLLNHYKFELQKLMIQSLDLIEK